MNPCRPCLKKKHRDQERLNMYNKRISRPEKRTQNKKEEPIERTIKGKGIRKDEKKKKLYTQKNGKT